MNDERKNRDAKGLWWKRFFYNVTGADYDYEVGPNWYASVMGTGVSDHRQSRWLDRL